MAARVLVLNAGSSTLKASVVELAGSDTGPAELPEPVEPLVATTVSWGSDATADPDRTDDLRRVLASFEDAGVAPESLTVVGHRVVHGGPHITVPALVTEDVLDELDDIESLAPLHNPVATEVIHAARSVLPSIPHVAAFDTAFHAALPLAARRYPVPARWRELGIRRYGFHGLSVEWSAARAAVLLGRPASELGLVVAHLGSGCSVTAVDGGRSVDTSMGFTPLEGLMMGTRSGSIDPGILLHLLRTGEESVESLAEALDHRSGLLGVSGVSGDVREVRAAAEAGSTDAALALELFARSAARAIAAATTSLRRFDALVFTAGIGEHDGAMRDAIVERLSALGLPSRLSEPADGGDCRLTTPGASPAVLRVVAREDLVIASAALRTAREAAPAR